MSIENQRSLCFDDLVIGTQFVSTGRTVTDADIVLFAGLSGDFTRIHLDEEYGRRGQFGGRVAHGALALSIATGLITQMGVTQDTAMALLEISVRFTAPVRIGDTIHVEQSVKEKKVTSKPDRGIVTFEFSVVNQSGGTVLTGSEKVMVCTRAAREATRQPGVGQG